MMRMHAMRMTCGSAEKKAEAKERQITSGVVMAPHRRNELARQVKRICLQRFKLPAAKFWLTKVVAPCPYAVII